MYLYKLPVTTERSYCSDSALKKTANIICSFLMLSVIHTHKAHKANTALDAGSQPPTNFLYYCFHFKSALAALVLAEGQHDFWCVNLSKIMC